MDKRIEVLTPIPRADTRAAIYELLEVYLQDNQQSWNRQPDGTWARRQPTEGEAPLEAQVVLLERRGARMKGSGR
jgi:polyphosphate kinase